MTRFLGIIPPMATPFGENEDVDEAALRKDINYLIQSEIHGIAVCGSTGEGHTLTIEETRRICQIAIEEANGQVPIIAGIIQDSTRQVSAYAKAIKDTGIAALQVTPVHYLFAPDEAGMYQYYSDLASEVGLPIIIYNVVPWNYLSPKQLAKLITEIELVVGVKQSSGDMHALADLLELVGDKGSVLAAVDDLLYPCFQLGAHGSIAAILTVVPKLSVRLWNAVKKGDQAEALEMHKRLLKVWRAVEGKNMPARIKYALELQGRPAGKARRPVNSLSLQAKEEIKKALQEAGVI